MIRPENPENPESDLDPKTESRLGDELNRLLQILSEYPGLGIEIALQVKGDNYKEGREMGEKRIGFMNTYFEMAGIGSDRRNIYLLENPEIRTNNNLPIQVLIRFFYRS